MLQKPRISASRATWACVCLFAGAIALAHVSNANAAELKSAPVATSKVDAFDAKHWNDLEKMFGSAHQVSNSDLSDLNAKGLSSSPSDSNLQLVNASSIVLWDELFKPGAGGQPVRNSIAGASTSIGTPVAQ